MGPLMIHRCFADSSMYRRRRQDMFIEGASYVKQRRLFRVTPFNRVQRCIVLERRFAIYTSNKLSFALTSLFFRIYKLRAFIRFTGARPPAISRALANNANAIGERERRAFRCMRGGRRKTPIVIERKRKKNPSIVWPYLRIDIKPRFEMLVVPFLPARCTTISSLI